jgi:hypothetical protein
LGAPWQATNGDGLPHRPLFEIAGSLFAVALTGKGGLDALLLARLQVVGVTLDFLDDVLLLNLPLKAA